MGRATAFYFGPAPWGPGEGSKSQISFNFNYSVNFKDFYSKLCVGWLVGFVALRPKSTSMVIAGRSVHLTTLFPGQA